MINQNMRMIDGIIHAFERLGLTKDNLDKIRKYLNDKIELDEFKKELPTMSFPFRNNNFSSYEFINCIDRLKLNKNTETYDKIISLIYMIGKETANKIIDLLYYHKINHESFYNIIKTSKIPKEYYILYYIDQNKGNYWVQKDTEELNKLMELEKCYKNEKQAYLKVKNNQKGKNKLIMEAVILKLNNQSDFQELKKVVANEIFKEIEDIFKSKNDNTSISLINTYILPKEKTLFKIPFLNGDAKQLTLNEILDNIKKNNKMPICFQSKNWFVVTMYYLSNEMEEAYKALKLLYHLNVYQTLDVICKNKKIEIYSEELKQLLKYLDSESNYAAWLSAKYNVLLDNYKYNIKIRELIRDELDKEYQENNNRFMHSIKKTTGSDKALLYSYLWKDGKALEEVKSFEDECIQIVQLLLTENKYDKKIIEDFISYINNEKNMEELTVKQLIPVNKNRKDLDDLLKTISFIFPYSKQVENIMIYIFNCERFQWYLLDDMFDLFEANLNFTYTQTLNSIIESGINKLDIMIPMVKRISDIYGDHSMYDNAIIDVVARDIEVVRQLLKEGNVKIKEYVLKLIINAKEQNKIKYEQNEYMNLYIKYIGDSSKKIRNIVVNQLSTMPDCKDIILEYLNSKKTVEREMAIYILGNMMDENINNKFLQLLEEENNPNVKTALINYTQSNSNIEIQNINIYCKQNIDKRMMQKYAYLQEETLPNLITIKGDILDDNVKRYIIITCSRMKEVVINTHLRTICKDIDNNSLAEFTYEVINRWLINGADTQSKQLLNMISMFGDSKSTVLLYQQIIKWVENKRGAIASYAVGILALQGTKEALMFVDHILRKVKHKQVKMAASQAIENAAKQLNISRDAIQDMLIPNLGFDENGEKIIDYGSRQFIVKINRELKLTIINNEEKAVKTLPKANKTDDEEKVSKAQEELKLLKKQLRDLVKIQSSRLEQALANNRLWDVDKWIELFVNNVVMQQFAIGLIWGVYEDCKLKQCFRYMEDGTFNTIADEEYELKNNVKIALVHPLEISKEELEQWKEQLEDYEVTQPINQLGRKIFILEEEEKEQKRLDRFGGIKVSEYAILKLEKMGWSKGSVRDGGCYTECYKENSYLEIGVEIRFDSMCAGYITDDDVILYEIIFYNIGTVERGSYVYDYVKPNECLALSEIPERFFSEIIKEIDEITINNNGRIDNWKEEGDYRWRS